MIEVFNFMISALKQLQRKGMPRSQVSEDVRNLSITGLGYKVHQGRPFWLGNGHLGYE